MVAPVIPGLNDREIAGLLRASAEAGARSASYVLLRLPYQVKAVFVDWLHRCRPAQADRVLSLLRQARGGRLYDATFGRRMRGQGGHAAQIASLFDLFRRRHGLERRPPDLSSAAFRRPACLAQWSLF
jgi:DNA repair photolyase